MRTPDNNYDQVVWSAMRTAYAAHVRNLLEFFHCEKPSQDVCWTHLADDDSNPFGSMKGAAKGLWERASKQVAHLSQNRSGKNNKWGTAAEWESDPTHREEIVPKIQTAVDEFGSRRGDVPEVLKEFLDWEADLCHHH